MRLPPQVELDLQAAENRIDELNKGQKAGPTRLHGLRSSIEAALRSQPAPAERTALERTCVTCVFHANYEGGRCRNGIIRSGQDLQTFGCTLWAGPQGAAGAGVNGI